MSRKPSWTRVFLRLTEILGVLLFVVVLYADVVDLPFFGDDPADLRWIEGSTFANIWTSAAGVGYFRPLAFSIWWADRWFLGGYNPALQHAANLVFHALSALLATSLVRHLVGGRGAALASYVAGALFIAYPFTYQAIPWVASLPHPLSAFLILGSMLTLLRPHEGRPMVVRCVSAALAVAALFAHESSVVLGPLAALVVYTRRRGRFRLRDYVLPAGCTAAGLLYLPVYFSVPRQTAAIAEPALARLTQVGAYVAQGIAYPVAPAFRLLMTHAGLSDLTSAYLAGAVTMLGLLTIGWRVRRTRCVAFGFAWYAVAVAPASIMLSYDYLLDAARVLYLASVGSTLAWAVAISGIARGWGSRPSVVGRAGASVLAAGILGFSVWFVRGRLDLYALGGDFVWQMAEQLAGSPASGHHLVVNFPAWLAPGAIIYPVGHEGVEFLPSFAGVSDLVWANSGFQPSVRAVKFSNALPSDPGYYYGVRGRELAWQELAMQIRDADHVHLAEISPDRLRLRPVGRVTNGGGKEGSMLALFDHGIELWSAQAIEVEERGYAVRLVWHGDGPIDDADYRVFAHAYGPDGRIVAQADGYPMAGLYPFWIWRPSEDVVDERYVDSRHLDDSVPRFAVGIYDAADGSRLTVTRPDGRPYEQDRVPVAVSASHSATPGQGVVAGR